MDLMTYGLVFAGLTALSTWLLQAAYKRTKIVLKHKSASLILSLPATHLSNSPSHACFRISMKREGAVSKEVLADLAKTTTGKKLSKAEKDER